jgi:hypothetical protein
VLRRVLIVCASSALLLQSARAQTAAVSWPPLSHLSESSLYTERPAAPLDLHPLAEEPSDTVVRRIKPTYWKEGGLVGGVAAGAFLAYLAGGLCQSSDTGENCGGAAIGGAVLGAGVGFGLGALIGGQFPKQPKRISSDSADVR